MRGTVVLLAVAAVGLVGAVLSLVFAPSPVDIAPIADGQPTTTSVTYSAPLLFLAFVLLTIAGICAVLGVSRLRDR